MAAARTWPILGSVSKSSTDAVLRSIRPLQIPGVAVPEAVQKALNEAGPNARDKGFELAREIFLWAQTAADGAYIIPPFKKYVDALEVLP